MSGIEVRSNPIGQLVSRRVAPPDAGQQAPPLSNPTPVSRVPVNLWETAGFGVFVAIDAAGNRRGNTSVVRCARSTVSHPAFGIPRSRPRSSRLSRWALFVAAACLAVAATAAEVRPERWRWSNPLPHGNNVMDMLVESDVAVQVGDGGTVYVQGLDERWAPASSGVTNYLRGVALMGGRFLVVGENGCILWSDDGNVFQRAQVSPTTANWFEGVAASAQRAVAVGDNGAIYTTTNGTNWTQSPSGTSEWLRGVAFGGSAFVAVGENGTILRSTSASGTSWNKTTVGTAHLNRVRYLGTGGAGQFYVVGNGGAAFTSTTGGSSWTSLNTGSTNNLYDVALNDTGLLAVGDQQVRFLASGQTSWTNHITDLPTNTPPAW